MRLVQVITDYIRRSILTIKGDLVVRGDSQPERLASGLLKTFLAGQGLAEIPAWEGHKLSDHGMATGTFTRDTPGDEVISGLGFRPSLVFFFTRCDVPTDRNWSVGVDSGIFRVCLFSYNTGTRISISLNYSVFIQKLAGNYLEGQITNIGETGFTFTFIGAGSSCAVVVWLAIE